MKTISIFGSTGSIGKSSIEIIKNNLNDFLIISLVAKSNYKLLAKQAEILKPKYVVIEEEQSYLLLKEQLKNLKNCQILSGKKAVQEVAKIKCDLFISAIVGSIGMIPTINAINAGSNIALANKESLVCAGDFLMAIAKKNNVSIIPIDSEHNAIFQIFENDNLSLIEDITLTASGGPFFNSKKLFSKISVNEALKHPNWKMGAKISIDSATMMNKGLEMIEAYHIFPVNKEQIKIIIHPQSIIHGIVNYKDGASLAMMSLPDMKVPISYALNYPNRMKIAHKKLDLAKLQKLEFYEVDEKKFLAIKLCREALNKGGNSMVILNSANEVAVAKFLSNQITFDKITKIVAKTLEKIPFKKPSSIEEIIYYDNHARNIANKIK